MSMEFRGSLDLEFHGISWNLRFCCLSFTEFHGITGVVQMLFKRWIMNRQKNIYVSNRHLFLNDRPWILPWINATSNKLDIIIYEIASQLSDHCDVIHNRLCRHPQNVNHVNRASETRGRVLFSYLSPSWKNTQITLSWAQNQFGTRLHTLFLINVYSAVMFRI